MRMTIKQNLAGKWGRIVALTLAAGATALSTAQAFAGDRGYDRGREYGYRQRWEEHNRESHDDEARVGVNIEFGRSPTRYEERQVRVWVEPVYKTVCDRVWVEPEYRTVCDRVWREPVVRIECERVWVPARYEEHWVTRVDCRGWRERVCERVCVEPGHFDERRHEVVVKPGCWETVERRELVCAGHWKTVERQELVCDGHYEWRTERVKVADGGWRDGTRIGFGVDLK
jgi:hypothetical protein